MNARHPSQWLNAFLSVLFLALFIPHAALADECNVDGTCTYVPITTTTTPATQIWVPQDFQPVQCEVVSNYCASEIMVPHKTSAEWSAFIYNHENCAALGDCLAGVSWIVGTWGPCSASCGGGIQYATGSCYGYDQTTNSYVTPIAASYCGAIPLPSQACNTQACVTYAWAGWGACSASCGGGTQLRSCDGSDGSHWNNASLCGGGPGSQSCNPQDCAAYGWGDWSACSASCGGGIQVRTCNGTDGSQGDDPALCGNGPQVQQCNMTACVAGTSCTPPKNPGGSYIRFSNGGNPLAPSCAAGCEIPNAQTGDCTCPAGYMDGNAENTAGSYGDEGCTGFTHNCLPACGGSFMEYTDGKDPFGPRCNGNLAINNPVTNDLTCPPGFHDGVQTNTYGSIGHEGCTGFTHYCVGG